MGHYKSNLRDQQFVLFEVLDRDDRLGLRRFGELATTGTPGSASAPRETPSDAESAAAAAAAPESTAAAAIDEQTAREILVEVDRLARGPLAEPFADADRNPPVFDPDAHSVTLPASFTKAYQAMIDGGWDRLGVPEEIGGNPVPNTLWWAVAELILGANPAAHFYASGASFAGTLHALGTAEQRRLAQLMVARHWASTMVITEPDAGSDVGAGRTKAIPQPDGSWHIQGVKRFITSGEWDWPENIVHLVLARPEGAGPGTKGLSLFVVPKWRVDLQTGKLGERNGVFATGVEHKMGLRVSATCELTFGADTPAVGWLLGGVHDGIAQMFTIIEHARMTVGTKAIATLSTGYLNALDYARTRVQGADLTQLRNREAPRVRIIGHPDVRRMLMMQKAYAEGLRTLVLYAAQLQDAVAFSSGDASRLAAARNDLLLPLVKGVGSERSYEMLSLAVQTLGGSGYLQDYPVEQYIRDAKIDTLYEGTTGIQAQDLFFRKIVRDDSVALRSLLEDINATAADPHADARLKDERAALGAATGEVEAIVATMVSDLERASDDPTEIYKVGLNSVRLLMSLGDLIIGWLLMRRATVALAALDGEPTAADATFYAGVIGAARFFAATILPEISARRVVAERVDNTLMDLDPAAF